MTFIHLVGCTCRMPDRCFLADRDDHEVIPNRCRSRIDVRYEVWLGQLTSTRTLNPGGHHRIGQSVTSLPSVSEEFDLKITMH